MAIKRNCDKCSNKVSSDWCTMQKDMTKAYDRLCDGFTQAPINTKPIWKPEETQKKYIANIDTLGNDFYNYLKKGGAWSFNPKTWGRIF